VAAGRVPGVFAHHRAVDGAWQAPLGEGAGEGGLGRHVRRALPAAQPARGRGRPQEAHERRRRRDVPHGLGQERQTKAERAVLCLRDIEDVPTDEVARMLGLRPGTVRTQIASARRKVIEFCRTALHGRDKHDKHRHTDPNGQVGFTAKHNHQRRFR
jgi:hypothetical protein